MSKYKIYIRRPTSDGGKKYVDEVLAQIDEDDFFCNRFDKEKDGNIMVHFLKKEHYLKVFEAIKKHDVKLLNGYW